MSKMRELTEASQIISDYAQECSTIDEGNLYFAATQYESAYFSLKEQCEKMKAALEFYATNWEQRKNTGAMGQMIYPNVPTQALIEDNGDNAYVALAEFNKWSENGK